MNLCASRFFFAVVAVGCFGQRVDACAYCDAVGCGPCPGFGASDAGDPSESAIYAATDEVSNFFTNRGQWPQPGGDGAPVTVTYSYNNFLDGGMKNLAGESISADYLRLVTEEAFGLWAAVAPLNFIEVTDVGTLPYRTDSSFIYPTERGGSTIAPVPYRSFSPSGFGQIRINHSFINGTDAENGMPTTKALAFFPSSSGNIGGDIHFDNGDPWEVIGTPSEPDVLGIMVHEIGHAIGLQHSAIEGTVMFGAALRRSGPGTGVLRADDIARVRAVYGAGVGSVTPLVVVPEPVGALVAVLGIVGLACHGRRRRVDAAR